MSCFNNPKDVLVLLGAVFGFILFALLVDACSVDVKHRREAILSCIDKSKDPAACKDALP